MTTESSFHRHHDRLFEVSRTGGKKVEAARAKKEAWMAERHVLQVSRLLAKMEQGGLLPEEAAYLTRNIDRIGMTYSSQKKNPTT